MRKITIAWTVALAAALCCCVASPAQADFGFSTVGTSLTGAGGGPARQAGSHPDFETKIIFNTYRDPVSGAVIPDEAVREVHVDLPVGMIGNPTNAATCPPALLNTGALPSCPVASQVGSVRVVIHEQDTLETTTNIAAVFNMTHGPNIPALFAFNYSGVTVNIVPRVRPDDYGISADTEAISQAETAYAFDLTLWGVPGAAVHESLRQGVLPGEPPVGVLGGPGYFPALPFLTAPTSCDPTPAPPLISAASWENQGRFVASSAGLEAPPFVTTGCDKLSFQPSIDVQPTSHVAGAPTGLQVDISVPQNESPEGLATPDLRKAIVTLPKGMAVSASSAAGLGACSQAQIGIGTNDPPTCPDSSKIGTVKIKTPLLEEELEGDVILAKQKENPFGSLLALYLAVKGPGFYLKLPGEVEADSSTGQLTATFSNTPQLPFEDLHLELNGGPQAPLVAPPSCGTYETDAALTSWASETQTPVSLDTSMSINQGCHAPGFDPKLSAGTASPIAGSPSPFLLRVTREDGEQNLSRIEATLPEGVLAKLAGVPLCPDGQATTGDCPAASQVGTTTVGAGPGPSPIYVPEAGKAPTAVYLAGPYKGAPYSLIVKVPAQAGPFDLGTVTVRNGLYVDPYTTQVTAKSDPLPQILEGIPLSYRDVRVEINRPDFTVNPTNCEPKAVTSTITSITGATARPSSFFQVTNCAALDFAPKLALSLKGGTARAKDPALKAVLTAPAGQANIGKVQVVLPKSVFIDNRHISDPCTRVQFDAGAGNGTQCPAKSILGKATAYSPLLSEPLTGKVYFRSNGGERKLPDLVASLDGPIHVNLVGFIDSVHKKGSETSRTRNTFASVPDAPVSRFVLELSGGKKGLLQNSTNLCKSTNKATVKMDGQNGKVQDFETVVKPSCGKAKSKKPAKRK